MGIIGCGPSKNQAHIRAEIEPQLVLGKTTRKEVVALVRQKEYEVKDEPNLPNLFEDRNCEYMPASYTEERTFGSYITVIEFCFDPKTKVLAAYRFNDTTSGPMFFP